MTEGTYYLIVIGAVISGHIFVVIPACEDLLEHSNRVGPTFSGYVTLYFALGLWAGVSITLLHAIFKLLGG